MNKDVICALALLVGLLSVGCGGPKDDTIHGQAVAPPAVVDVVFEATPDSRVDSGPESTTRTIVRGEERSKGLLIITRKNRRYFWTTREDRDLIYSRSGAFHLFIAPGGAGYVKVLDTHLLPKDAWKPGPRYQYIEHVGLMLGTLTYWGSSERLLVADD